MITRLEQQFIEFIEGVANRCDLWAEQSRSGGWSTHQVEDNRKMAEECRRFAATARQPMPDNVEKERSQLLLTVAMIVRNMAPPDGQKLINHDIEKLNKAIWMERRESGSVS